MQAEVRNPRWRLKNRNTYISACTQRSFTISKAISMFSKSRNSMKLFFILCDASGSQKSKMPAYKKGNTHFSACIQYICTILTAKQVYIKSMRVQWSYSPSKTEFLLIGTKQQRLKFSQLTTLSLDNDIIPVGSSARNLGFIFDSDMSFTDQINSLSNSCHFHIRDIRRIRHLLPLSAATALANSLVSSKLDHCNSLYNGISQANLNKIQRIQNTLALVVTNTSKFEHITPILKNYIGFQSHNFAAILHTIQVIGFLKFFKK